MLCEASEDSIEEICKIFWAFNNLNYKNEGLADSLKLYLDNNIDKISINHLLDLFNSFANIYPDKVEVTQTIINVITILTKSKLIKIQTAKTYVWILTCT
jgi:hypothetical protein